MSAPETNVERQAKRHYGPLLGIVAALVFAFVIAVIVIGVMGETDEPVAPQDMNPVMEDNAN